MSAKSKFGIFLTILAGGGFIYTIFLTAKKAPEAKEAKEKALADKREQTGDENVQLTFMESAKAQLPCYIPVIATSAATIGGIIGSQILPQGAYSDIKKLHDTYKDISTKINGPQSEKLIDAMVNQKLTPSTDDNALKTFVLNFNDQNIIFEASELQVMMAEYDTNRFFKGSGGITFNQMLQLFTLNPVDRGDEFGWDEVLGDAFYGYSWIEFTHRNGMLNGKPVIFIEFPYSFHSLSEEDIEIEDEDHGIFGDK